jgi:hypothetical protein
VEVIQVHAGPHNLNKFRKRVAAYGQSSLIRCQVAGNDVRGARCNRAKISATTKVGRRVDYGGLSKVWILVWNELIECRASAVTLIAWNMSVYDITA